MTTMENRSFVPDITEHTTGLWKAKRETITIQDILNDPNGFGPTTVLSLYGAENGVGLSEAYDSIKKLFEDLNA